MDDFIKVSTSIHKIASSIVDFKDVWVTLSDDYLYQVEELNSRLSSYQEHFGLHGLTDRRLMRSLKHAEDTLKRAASRLEGFDESASINTCSSHIRFWYAKLFIVLFPENIENIVKKVNQQINDILNSLKEDAEISTQLREANSRRAIPTVFRDPGKLYVPLKKIQSAVIEAIEDPEGPRIVLLHGGVGKGKSTLAKDIHHLYETGNSADEENGRLFDHVIWVSCSNCSKDDVSTKQLEILRDCSPDSLGDSPPNVKSGQARIAQALKDFLSAKKVLIILDGVLNHTFLYKMWEVTVGVKSIRCLITSQKGNICNMAGLSKDSLPLRMEDATHDEAKRILAALVGLPAIPEKLQEVADKIIRATERNPLALACLARYFAYSEDNTNQRAWQDAYIDLHKLLNNTAEKIVFGSTGGNLWAAMKLCIDTLESRDAKKILFLMYECKAESVPEAVLSILHSRTSSSSTFFPSLNELRMLELLKPAVNSKEKKQNDGENSNFAWSLGPLVRHYIEEHMVVEIQPVIGELVGDEELRPESRTTNRNQVYEAQTVETEAEKASVAISLCALYFDQSHSHIYELVTKAMTRTNIGYASDSFSDLRRQAVEPIIWLLDKRAEEHWKDEDVCCVRKVFLTYVYKSEFDDENISHLLKLEASTQAQLATLKTIQQICYIEEKLLFNANNLTFLRAIVSLMDLNEGLPTNLQEAAFGTLRAVCWKVGDQMLGDERGDEMAKSKGAQDPLGALIIDTPGLLDVLVSALASVNPPSDAIVANAADSFGILSYCEGSEGSSTETPTESICERILSKKGALLGLVKCLFEHGKPFLQTAATMALRSLAGPESTCQMICDQEGALEGLVKLLSAHDKRDLQQLAIQTIANLAKTCDNTLKLRIANQDGALDSLLICVAVHEQPDLQLTATNLLYKLAQFEEGKTLVKGTDGLLEGLSSLLEKGIGPEVQYLGALTLTFINPALGKEASLTSGKSYSGRAHAFIFMSMYVEALADLDKAADLLQGTDPNVLSSRAFVKAKLEDLKGALDDANEAVKVSNCDDYALQERGVLKRIMGDLPGALADLNEVLKKRDHDYECLKHRGYVKFLLKDEEGARADAQRAHSTKPSRVDKHEYGIGPALGTSSVEYLGYKLK